MMSGKDSYVKARKLLEERFVETYVVSNAQIEKLSEGPPINQNDREALLDLADDLESCETTLTVADRLNQISNEDNMMKILRRLPLYLRIAGRKGYTKSEQMVETPTLKILRK